MLLTPAYEREMSWENYMLSWNHVRSVDNDGVESVLEYTALAQVVPLTHVITGRFPTVPCKGVEKKVTNVQAELHKVSRTHS